MVSLPQRFIALFKHVYMKNINKFLQKEEFPVPEDKNSKPYVICILKMRLRRLCSSAVRSSWNELI